MTGKRHRKNRVYLSRSLFSPLSEMRDFDEAAIGFKNSVINSMNSARLNADLAVKALPGAKDSDGKKRTNTGEIPGVVDVNGVRFKPGEKGGENKTFLWLPNLQSKINESRKDVNFGWVEKAKPEAEEKRKKPEIRVRKYKISPKTGGVIEGSEERVNPYKLWSGEPMEKSIEFKKLPGMNIGRSVAGGSLGARAAAKLGIWVDDLNKFRCPPGSPAANQFTDASGSNCFGFSPGKLIDFARRVTGAADEMSRIELSERDAIRGRPQVAGLSSGRVFNNMWWKNHWGVKQTRAKNRNDPWSPELDLENVSVEETPSEFRWFVSGGKRARTGLEASKRRVAKLQDSLGIESSPEKEAVNADRIEAIEELNKRGLLELKLTDRKSYGEVVSVISSRLRDKNPEAWAKMSDNQRQQLIEADVDRWYATERSMLDALLDTYIQMPEHIGKNLRELSWSKNPEGPDEARANAFGSGFEHSTIGIDLETIMDNQEAMLPSLDEYSRMRIDAIGGSDSENAQAANDFLVSSQLEARRTAALALGHEGFARHIMYHELGHTLQIAAVGRKIKSDIDSKGYYEYVDYQGNLKKITEIDQITPDAVIGAFSDPDFLESINNVMSRSESVKFLAGSYPQTVENPGIRAAEVSAELFALRMSGLIWGDDVDAALEWMDDVHDGRFFEDRAEYDLYEQEVFNSSGSSPLIKQSENVIYYQSSIDDVRKRRNDRRSQNLKDVKTLASDLSEDEIIKAIIAHEASAEKAKIDGNLEDSSYFSDIAKEYEKAGNSKFKDSFSDILKTAREQNGLLSDKEISEIAEKRRIEEINNNVNNDAEEQLLNRLAEIEVDLMQDGISEDLKSKLQAEKRKYRQAIRDRRSESDENASVSSLNKFIDKKVDAILTSSGKNKKQKPKPKTFNSKKDAEEHALNERAKLLKTATPQERDAITQLADPEQVDIGNILDPEKQVGAAKAINKRNRRAIKMYSDGSGADVDDTSRLTGSLVGQVDNILIPSLELIDRSELTDAIEIETTLDLDLNQLGAKKDADLVIVDGILTGSVLGKKRPFNADSLEGNPTDGGKKPTRVMVRVQAGQKGHFPHWSDLSSDKPDDYEQKLLLPPGKLKIVGTKIDDDGNEILIAEIVHQNDPMQSLDSMVSNIGEEGPNPNQHAKGTRRKLEKSVNSHAARRRKEGKSSTVVTPVTKQRAIEEKTKKINDDIDAAKPSSPQRRTPKADPDPLDDVYGEELSPVDRKVELQSRTSGTFERLRDIIQFGVGDDDIEITESDVPESVRTLLKTKSNEELSEIIIKQALEFHNSVDKRPRVRISSEELGDIFVGPSGRPLRYGDNSFVNEQRTRDALSTQLKEALDTLTTDESKKFAASMTKKAIRNRAEKGLDYLVEDGTIDLETKKKLEEILDVAIPEDEADFDSFELFDAIKSVVEKQKAKNSARRSSGLSSGLVGTAVTAWNEWNNADPDNLQNSKDMLMIALLMKGVDATSAEDWAFGKLNAARAAVRTRREKRRGLSSGAKKSVSSRGEEIFKPESIDDALKMIKEGKLVELDSVGQVSTLIDKLNEIIQDALSKGDKAPDYDLCRVSVPGTNLFCSDSKGIERINMPQFSGTPVPGSEADKLPKDKGGGVDGTKAFEEHLSSIGIGVKRKKVKASELKATQNELVGSKVVGMITNEKFDPEGEAIFVSRDGYVIDGHHRWAAQVGRDLSDGKLGDLELNVIVVDSPISEILREANKWATDFGMASKSGKGDGNSSPPVVRDIKKGATPDRSPGLKANRDRPMSEYGMDWKLEYTEDANVESAKTWDGWDDVPVSKVDLDLDILPTESHLKGSSIDKVVSGEEPFREGYDPYLLIDETGKIFVIDGHNRVAMHRALGNKNMQARVLDLRETSAPWQTQDRQPAGLSSGRSAGLSSGRKTTRHSNRDPDLERQFPDPEENAKREAHEKFISDWEAGMDMSFTTIERQRDEVGGRFSPDFLRAREVGYNDARSRWFGKGTAEQPKNFNPKQKASTDYSSWYRNTVSQLGRGKANRSQDADREQEYAGEDAGIRDFLMSVAPDTSGWSREDRESLAKLEDEYGFGRGGSSPGRSAGLSSGRKTTRHSNRDPDLERQFPDPEENAKREAHEKFISDWEAGMDMSFTTIERQRDEVGGRFSPDFLRAREVGYNDARSRWFGKGTAEQPKNFNPKQKASTDYSSWYRNTVSQLGRGKANRSQDADREQEYAGEDAGIRDFLMSVAPDTSGWSREDRESLAKLEDEYGFGRGGSSPGRSAGLSSGKTIKKVQYRHGGYDMIEPDNPEPKPGAPRDVIEAATAQREKLVEAEKEITKTMIDLANKHKGQMRGLDFRIKAIKSLVRKILDEKDTEHGGDAQKAAESMSDVIRYTTAFDPEEYVSGVKGMVEELQAAGYKLRIKNYWKGDDPYQGINIAAIGPDGTKFELQFHTPQSVEDKEEIHKLYETYRESKDNAQRRQLYDEMVQMANKIGVPYPPDELLSIGEVKFQPFQEVDIKSLIRELETMGVSS